MPIAFVSEHISNSVRTHVQAERNGTLVSRRIRGKLPSPPWFNERVADAGINESRIAEAGIIGIIHYKTRIAWQDDLTRWNREEHLLWEAARHPTHAYGVEVLSFASLDKPLEVYANIGECVVKNGGEQKRTYKMKP